MTTVITREAGYAGFSPEIVRIVTTATLAQVQTAGWYNNSPIFGESLSNVDQAQICYAYGTSSQATAIFNIAISSVGVVTFTLAESSVTLPTIANHIATYTNTAGGLGEDANPAINGGSIQAGLSGTAGFFTSYPGTAANGTFVFKAINNSNNFASTLSNAAVAQATTYTLPDPGAATANIILSTAGSAQTIAGGLTISTGNLGVTAGNVTAGSSGHAGTVTSFPGTAANGSFVFQAINNSNNFASTLNNAAVGQATVYTFPDPGATTANVILSASSGTQTITTGSLSLTAGAVIAANNNIQAGSNTHGGSLLSYPAGNNLGRLFLTAVNSAGAFDTIISNASMGQGSTISIPDPGAATANFLLDHGTNTLAAGAKIIANKVNGTEAANAVTASGMAGLITTSALTTAGAGSYAITWTNTFITATSVVLLTIAGGTNTTENITLKVVPGSGTATLTIYNNTAATSLNGTILISYLVM